MDLNRRTLSVFAPMLLVVGAAGFAVPKDKAITSGAPAYNAFHLAFGALGLSVLRSGRPAAARAFNLGFGAIDLYQAVASRTGRFPKRAFRWKPADDVLHVVVGAALVAVGLSRCPKPST